MWWISVRARSTERSEPECDDEGVEAEVKLDFDRVSVALVVCTVISASFKPFNSFIAARRDPLMS